MERFNRILTICSVPLFILTIFLTYKFLTIANHETKQQILNKELPIIVAKDDAVKIYPEKDKSSEDNSNQMIYEFVNNEQIVYDPEIQELDTDQYTKLPDKKKYTEKTKDAVPEEEAGEANVVISNKKPQAKISITTAQKPESKVYAEETHMLQIGAFSNKKNALTKWDALVSNYPQDFKNIFYKIFYVENNVYGGLYKLKIGPFKSEDKARKFCKELRMKNVSCFYATE